MGFQTGLMLFIGLGFVFGTAYNAAVLLVLLVPFDSVAAGQLVMLSAAASTST